MMLLYSLGLALALVVSAPWWLLRMATSGRYRDGLAERLGFAPRRLSVAQGCVWLHAVSVGEVLAAAPLIAEMERAGWKVAVSTTTRAGQTLARERFGARRVFYFPLDFGWAVRTYLRALRPRALVLMESELWPRVLVECERAGVPVIVANARVSDRSWPRYRALRFLWKPLLRKVRVLLAQTEEDARRWRAIGAWRVEVAGNLKYDVRDVAANELVETLRAALPPGRVLVAGSTLEDEEAMLVSCWRGLGDGGVMLLAPRHPQRFESVAALCDVRLSVWRAAPWAIRGGSVVLVDTIGDLAALYALGDVAFVGGSLVQAGGHNPLEPARFGVPVMMGPSYENFRAMVDAMRMLSAIRIVTREELCAAMRDADAAMGERGRVFFASQAGATERVMRVLAEIVA